MEWYLKSVRDNYGNFNGRATRQEYWMFFLFNIIFASVVGIADVFLGLGFLELLYLLAVFIPGLAVSIRRLHDVGKSGWFLLISLIPLVGLIWLIVVLASAGNPGENEYGAVPK